VLLNPCCPLSFPLSAAKVLGDGVCAIRQSPQPGGPRCRYDPELPQYPAGPATPLLDSLTRGFHKRFQEPEEAVTIADRIN
jgi:hypothetical protein